MFAPVNPLNILLLLVGNLLLVSIGYYTAFRQHPAIRVKRVFAWACLIGLGLLLGETALWLSDGYIKQSEILCTLVHRTRYAGVPWAELGWLAYVLPVVNSFVAVTAAFFWVRYQDVASHRAR